MSAAVGWVAAAALLVVSAPAVAASPAGIASYALVIGNNRGGEGQQDLRYAVRDAQRMGELLIELGRYPRENVIMLLEPSVSDVDAAIATLDAAVAGHDVRGEQSRFFFYYSGHAKANALILGPESLPLTHLRERLRAVPSTVTVSVLDGCQSGAFSRIKGSAPTADFSYNSVQRLKTEGIAVLASSTAC